MFICDIDITHANFTKNNDITPTKRGKMAILLVVVPLLGCAKVLFQGKAVKSYVHNIVDSLVFVTVVFATVCICLAAMYLRTMPSSSTMWLGILLGLCNVVFQVSYNLAMARGPVSLTGVCTNFSIVVPLIVGFTVLGEAFTLTKGIALALVAVAFVLMQRKDGDKKANLVWLLLTLCATLSAGVSNVVMSVFKTLPVADERNLLIIVSNGFAAVLSIVTALVFGAFRKRSEGKLLMPMSVPDLLWSLFAGVTLAVYQPLSMLALTAIDVTVYYPVTGALAVIFLMVSGIIIFREKPSAKQLVGAAMGLVAVVLLNLR